MYVCYHFKNIRLYSVIGLIIGLIVAKGPPLYNSTCCANAKDDQSFT